jgi:hypothetical protein
VLSVGCVRAVRPLLLFVAACSCRAASRSPPSARDSNPDVLPSARLVALAKRCTRIASCAHPHDPPHFRDPGACVDWWLQSPPDPRDPLSTCLSAALTCEGIAKCLHPPAQESVAAYCRAHPGEMRACDGARLVLCSDDDPDESTMVDCGSLGARCAPMTHPGGLTTRACVDSARCPAEVTKATCDGPGAILLCNDGAIDRAVCKPGYTCEMHTEGDGEQAADCEVPGHVSCPVPGKRRCEGSRLIQCEAHGHFGHESSIDCAALALSCSADDGGARCTEGPPQCTGRASCEGNVLSFCAAGKRLEIDCGEIGLGACEADGRGPDAVCRSRGAASGG